MTSLVLVFPLTTKFWHPFMNKSTSVGIVGSSTICQGTQKVSHPPVHQVIDRTQDKAWNQQEPVCWLCPSQLQPMSNWKHWLGQTTVDERLCMSLGFQKRRFSTQKKEKKKCVCMVCNIWRHWSALKKLC